PATSTRCLLAATAGEAIGYRSDVDEVRGGKEGHFRESEEDPSSHTPSTQGWRGDKHARKYAHVRSSVAAAAGSGLQPA
ncbi:hypothetical protein LTR29_005192, partial [Friedmanniomyces endolithicus]